MNYFDIGTTLNNISTILCLSSSWFIEMRLKYFLKVVTNIFRLSCVQKCKSSRFFRNFGLRSFFWQYSGLLQGESLYLFFMQNNVLCWQDLNNSCLHMRKFVKCALQISVLINEKSQLRSFLILLQLKRPTSAKGKKAFQFFYILILSFSHFQTLKQLLEAVIDRCFDFKVFFQPQTNHKLLNVSPKCLKNTCERDYFFLAFQTALKQKFCLVSVRNGSFSPAFFTQIQWCFCVKSIIKFANHCKRQ